MPLEYKCPGNWDYRWWFYYIRVVRSFMIRVVRSEIGIEMLVWSVIHRTDHAFNPER